MVLFHEQLGHRGRGDRGEGLGIVGRGSDRRVPVDLDAGRLQCGGERRCRLRLGRAVAAGEAKGRRSRHVLARDAREPTGRPPASIERARVADHAAGHAAETGRAEARGQGREVGRRERRVAAPDEPEVPVEHAMARTPVGVGGRPVAERRTEDVERGHRGQEFLVGREHARLRTEVRVDDPVPEPDGDRHVATVDRRVDRVGPRRVDRIDRRLGRGLGRRGGLRRGVRRRRCRGRARLSDEFLRRLRAAGREAQDDRERRQHPAAQGSGR